MTYGAILAAVLPDRRGGDRGPYCSPRQVIEVGRRSDPGSRHPRHPGFVLVAGTTTLPAYVVLDITWSLPFDPRISYTHREFLCATRTGRARLQQQVWR